MICPLQRQPFFSSYGHRFFDSTALKVGLVAGGVFTTGGGIAAYLFQVNSIVSFTLIGGGGLLTAIPLLSFIRCPKGKREPRLLVEPLPLPNDQARAVPAQNKGVEHEHDLELDVGCSRTSTDDELDLLLTENLGFLKIKDRDSQIERFRALDKTSVFGKADKSSYHIGKPIPNCDSYGITGFPSAANRITLRGGIHTNGAHLWDKLILIQGPRDFDQVEQLWRIAAERQAGAIVRLGPVERYVDYCSPEYIPYEYIQLTIGHVKEESRIDLFNTTICMRFFMQHGEEERLFPVYAVEGWADFGTNQCEEIHRLFLELDQLEGPLIFHCRGGFGRTGTFAVCWKIYQELKSALEQRNAVEIDPVAIIDEMRFARTGTVQNIEQFEMILNYVDYLNRLHVQDAF